jgi:antitoxin (DNA-binding transcriptional repressor) of toxin-antitoxin stability system
VSEKDKGGRIRDKGRGRGFVIVIGEKPLTDIVQPCTIRFMKLSISEARKRLPELVRQVSKDAGAKIEITVHDEVVAELRAAFPEPEPGAAAKKLVALMRRLPKHRGRKPTYPVTLTNTFTVPPQRAVDGAAASSVL